MNRPLLLVWLLAGMSAGAAVDTYAVITSTGRIGTLKVTTEGKAVDVDWRVDDNGRGPKIRERIELGPSGTAVRREISGTAWVGAPVKESFTVEGSQARWTTLDDQGEAPVGKGIYLSNRGSPWDEIEVLRTLLASKGLTRPSFPSGTVRLEKVRSVTVGARKEKLDLYAAWGMGLGPELLLARGNRLVGIPEYGFGALVEEGFPESYDWIRSLARDANHELLGRIRARVAHRVDAPVWITHARLFDPVSKTSTEGRNVVVYDGRVVGVRSDAPPPGATVVDAAGGTLLPGLFDSHAHMDAWAGLLHVASGVTFVRDPGNDNQKLLQVVQGIESGELVGPRVTMSGFLEGRSPFSANDGFIIGSVEEGLERVRWYADHGFWGIKIYNSMPPEFVKPLAEEAHRLGMHVSGHVPAFSSSERVISEGYDEINHINQLLLMFLLRDKEDPRTPFRFTVIGERLASLDTASPQFQRLLALMKQRKITLDPTLEIFDGQLEARPGKVTAADAPWLDHVPSVVARGRRTMVLDIKPEQYATYEASRKRMSEIVALLHREGIPLVPGTDNIPGFALHSELEAWARAGIAPKDVLTAATLGGARFLGRESELGTIAVGKRADLYLVDGDPTVDISSIRKGRLVVKDGVFYFPDEIHKVLEVTPFATHVELRSAGPSTPAAR
jgi:hypothetical protein